MPSTGTRTSKRVKLPVNDVLYASMGVYFTNFAKFTLIALIVYCPLILLDVEESLGPAIVAILEILKQQILMAAIIFGVFRELKGESASIHDCIRVAVRKLIPLLFVLVQIAIFCFVLSLPLMIIVGGLVNSVAIPQSLRVVLTLLIFVPGLLFYSVMFAAPPAVVAEKIDIGGAIRLSILLTRGNRFRILLILGVNIFLMILMVVLSVFVIVTLRDHMGRWSILCDAVLLFMKLAVHTLMATAIALTYFRLKVIVEGVDEKELASIFDHSSTGE